LKRRMASATSARSSATAGMDQAECHEPERSH
jgi:hypothetical protein